MSEHTHSKECKVLLGGLSDYIDGELSKELCAQIEEHIRGCENCRIVVDTLRKTVELYESSGEPADLPSGVKERLFARLELEGYLKK